MNLIFTRTLGGLSRAYYMRQLFFGACLGGFYTAIVLLGRAELSNSQTSFFISFFVLNTLLYPYARFVYESVMDFIIGDKVIIILPLFVMMFWKAITIGIVWALTIFFAPIGLIYLFFYHSRNVPE